VLIMAKTRVGIVGASSYTARELLVRLIDHPAAEVACLMARVEKPVRVATMHGALRGRCDVPVEPISIERLTEMADVVFLCLPHGPAGELAKPLFEAGKRVVDLSADFRFSQRAMYERAYKQPHPAPELLAEAVYGLPELWREKIRGTRLVGNPGCYCTATILALAPLLREWPNELPAAGVVADCKSGVSGAGRTARDDMMFCEVNEGLKPYGLVTHRHSPEIDGQLTAWGERPIHVTFLPHLIPMERGICATVHVPFKSDLPPLDEVHAMLTRFAADEPFVRVLPQGETVNTSAVAHTNFVDLAVTADPQANLLVMMCAIDNLVKGASGQAIQNMNLMIGCEETAGLM
jgi:N-acetyl-gamma-glutamyl-phosphate reductase